MIILEHWRSILAVLISVVFVRGAYLLARGIELPQVARASSETALLQAIATKDSNGDGLPDWEKTLYGIPINSTTTDYFNLGMTDGEAVARGLIVPRAVSDISIATSSSASIESSINPSLLVPPKGSLTEVFAQSFFSSYLKAKQKNGGADLSQNDTRAIANQALKTLSSSIRATPNFKTIKQLNISGSGTTALKTFAIQAEAIMTKNTSDAKKSEIKYLQDALQKGDTTAYEHLSSISKAYKDTAVGLSVLQVPTELANTDLMLVNSFMRISQITNDFARANKDPLATILALKQYPKAVLELKQSFINIGNIYTTSGILLTKGAPGASFVNIASDLKILKPPSPTI